MFFFSVFLSDKEQRRDKSKQEMKRVNLREINLRVLSFLRNQIYQINRKGRIILVPVDRWQD